MFVLHGCFFVCLQIYLSLGQPKPRTLGDEKWLEVIITHGPRKYLYWYMVNFSIDFEVKYPAYEGVGLLFSQDPGLTRDPNKRMLELVIDGYGWERKRTAFRSLLWDKKRGHFFKYLKEIIKYNLIQDNQWKRFLIEWNDTTLSFYQIHHEEGVANTSELLLDVDYKYAMRRSKINFMCPFVGDREDYATWWIYRPIRRRSPDIDVFHLTNINDLLLDSKEDLMKVVPPPPGSDEEIVDILKRLTADTTVTDYDSEELRYLRQRHDLASAEQTTDFEGKGHGLRKIASIPEFNNSKNDVEIIEGTEDEYTFTVLLKIKFNDNTGRSCMGAIVHDNAVVTTAHCFIIKGRENVMVALDKSFVVIQRQNVFRQKKSFIKYTAIETITTHPRFEGWTADLALVSTSDRITSPDKYGRVIRLPSSQTIDSNENVMMHGRVEDHNEETYRIDIKSILISKSFGVRNIRDCSKLIEDCMPPLYHIYNQNEVICVESEDYKVTEEESGAPVVQNGKLVGVMVRGVECDHEYVAIAMKVACFCKWIAQILPRPRAKNAFNCCEDCCKATKEPERRKMSTYVTPTVKTFKKKGHQMAADEKPDKEEFLELMTLQECSYIKV